MINIQSLTHVPLLLRPPRKTTRLRRTRWDRFIHFTGKRREAKCGKAKGVAFLEDGAGRWGFDLGAVAVVGFPFCDVGEEGPDLGGGEVEDDDFVGDEVVGSAGEEFGVPDYGGLHFDEVK